MQDKDFFGLEGTAVSRSQAPTNNGHAARDLAGLCLLPRLDGDSSVFHYLP